MSADEAVIKTENLHKTFRLGLWMKKIEALRGVSFTVRPGEIFGFLGPNGAGKTTTIKIIVGLLRASEGTCELLGKPVGDIHVRKDVGYLPESPYFYDHLLPEEFMDLVGRLRGLGSKERKKRGDELLDIVGLSQAKDRPLRKFSKGMLQRIGLAQSLVSDPKLLILDEPMSGLDPVGRKEVRDLILDQRKKGKTIFFSSHILTDVESLCDRVAIVNEGKVVDEGSLADLLRPETLLVDIELKACPEGLREELADVTVDVEGESDTLHLSLKGEESVEKALVLALEKGAKIISVVPHRETLESLFVRHAIKSKTN